MTDQTLAEAVEHDPRFRALLMEYMKKAPRPVLEHSSASGTERLLTAYETFSMDQASFKPGMLVTWKRGLKNRTKPEYDQPAVVVACLEKPVYDVETRGAGSPYFQEPLDVILGVLDDEGDFLTFYFDRRRFREYEAERHD